MKKTSLVMVAVLLIASIALFFACSGSSVKTGGDTGAPRVVQNGVGKARNFDDALDLAFRDALRKAVVTLVGDEAEAANRDKLNTYVYGISETFIQNYEITDKVKSGKDSIVYVRVSFDRSKLEESLRTLEIPILVAEEKKDYSASPHAPLLNEAIDNLTYLVYFEPEKKNIADEYARLCINRVNNYLANQRYEYIELARILEIKDEYLKLYEETTGAVSVVQLIAQALNADIYIVVDGIVEDAGREGDIHFASAAIDLKAFESATARGLGTETGYSGKLGLASGMDAAKRKCVEVAVENAVEPVVALSREYMLKAFEDGIRYEVVVQGLMAYDQLQVFADAVRDARNFRRIREVSAAEGMAKYYVYYMGRKNEFIDEVINNLAGEEGFENFTVLVSRGNAVIFGVAE
jgi:uncharacterized protein (UPF0333 family)